MNLLWKANEKIQLIQDKLIRQYNMKHYPGVLPMSIADAVEIITNKKTNHERV